MSDLSATQVLISQGRHELGVGMKPPTRGSWCYHAAMWEVQSRIYLARLLVYMWQSQIDIVLNRNRVMHFTARSWTSNSVRPFRKDPQLTDLNDQPTDTSRNPEITQPKTQEPSNFLQPRCRHLLCSTYAQPCLSAHRIESHCVAFSPLKYTAERHVSTLA